jgi:hypothetical protein
VSGKSGIYERGSTEDGGIEFEILVPMLVKKLLNSSAMEVGSVRVSLFVLISEIGMRDFLSEVTSFKISQVFFGFFLKV